MLIQPVAQILFTLRLSVQNQWYFLFYLSLNSSNVYTQDDVISISDEPNDWYYEPNPWLLDRPSTPSSLTRSPPSSPQSPTVTPNIIAHDDLSQTWSPQCSNDIYIDHGDTLHHASPPVSPDPNSDSENADRTSGISRVYHPLISGMWLIFYVTCAFLIPRKQV